MKNAYEQSWEDKDGGDDDKGDDDDNDGKLDRIRNRIRTFLERLRGLRERRSRG